MACCLMFRGDVVPKDVNAARDLHGSVAHALPACELYCRPQEQSHTAEARGMHLVQIELRANDDTNGLVESRKYGQALLVLMPVVADNRLRGNFLRVDQLEASRNALLDSVPVLDETRFGVGVLVEVHRPVPAAGGKDIPVLREEVGAPYRRLRNLI